MSAIKSIHDMERSIIKSYRNYLWTNFIKAIKDFELIEEGDRIAVAISGGKDSLTLAKLFQELKRHSKYDFHLEFIAMDPGYKRENRELLEYNCKMMGIPVKIHNSDVFEVAHKLDEENPCYMCARMRRGNLYSKAKELGCNKLALGHHFNDVIETVLLNVLFAGNYKTMMPKLHSKNFEGLELIRPMYYIKEKSIISFMNSTGLHALDCACSVTEKKDSGMRFFIKDLIEDLRKVNKNVDINILRSAENVDIGAIVAYKKGDEKISFLDNYHKEEKY
ncbi:tRNA 2-thiocytidine biosynthesis protein [Peptoniphilus sp. ING2-D1G]|nr:tRNA 2-thiocytidine biosynthesis protein [Peptoniphilus sp. ING2-D1G]